MRLWIRNSVRTTILVATFAATAGAGVAHVYMADGASTSIQPIYTHLTAIQAVSRSDNRSTGQPTENGYGDNGYGTGTGIGNDEYGDDCGCCEQVSTPCASPSPSHTPTSPSSPTPSPTPSHHPHTRPPVVPVTPVPPPTLPTTGASIVGLGGIALAALAAGALALRLTRRTRGNRT